MGSKQSDPRVEQPPAAVVIGLDSMQGLQAARILAKHAVPVIGIVKNPSHAFAKTRVCSQILHAPTDSDDLITCLSELGQRLSRKAVLFPSEDPSVLLISRNRRRLRDSFHIALPEEHVVETLTDKVRFYAYAREHNLAVPLTHIIEHTRDLEQAVATLSFPLVLKPHDSAARKWEHHTVYKAFKVKDASEATAVFNEYRRWSPCFIAQEWIEGTDSDLYSCNCYFNSRAEPLVTFVARKIRQWPPETGISSLGEECRNDTVLRETVHLFSSMHYHGLGYLEMKYDNRRGKHFIVEPNIGRPTGRSAIAEGGGVELLYTAYCDAVGQPLPAERFQQYSGVKWMHVRKDLQSSFQNWRRGRLTIRQWWRSIRGRKVYALASWNDPAPFCIDWWHALSAYFSSRKRSKRRAPGSLATGG